MDSQHKDHSIKLEEFDADYFYEFENNPDTKYQVSNVKLKQDGIKLVSEYYSYKYQIEHIVMVDQRDELLFKWFDSETFNTLRMHDSIRIAFITLGHHSIPAAYIKEGSKEAFLFFDSLGYAPTDFAEVLSKYNITCYTVSKVRQEDDYSCHTDALVILRELTGKDKSGQYLIPNLISKLENENRISQHDKHANLKEIRLFDRLLITIQRQKLMNKQIRSYEPIHVHHGKQENIDEFLSRYPPDEFIDKNDIPKPYVSSYLRQKSLKYAEIIEIQFYLNQIKKVLGDDLTDTVKNDFIKDAKIAFKAEDKKTTLFHNKKHLHKLAQKYLDDYLLSKANKETTINPKLTR